jgi:CRISPR-associated protein, Csh1 family
MTERQLENFANTLEKHWHGRPPSCLEDVLSLYGILAVAAEGGDVFETPNALNAYLDDGRLVTIHVDLTGDSYTYEGLTVDTLREDHISRLGYSKKSSGRGADYSLTQAGSKTGNEPSEVADTHLGCIRRWCGYDSVHAVTNDDGHADGWVVNALGEIFQKDSESIAEIGDDIETRLTGNDPTVLTVDITIDNSDLTQNLGEGIVTAAPDELAVLQASMRRYSSANDADKNLGGSRTSEGQATGFVSDDTGRVVGTPESPLDTFSVKHPDVQPGLRRTASWRNYPIDETTAKLISKCTELIEQCVFREGGMETYALPYFAGEITAEKAQYLYTAIQSLDPDTENSRTPMSMVTYDLQEHDNESIRALNDELRFHYVTLPIGDDTHIITESSSATTFWINRVSKMFVETLQGPTGNIHTGGFSESPNWSLLEYPSDVETARRLTFDYISSHQFIDATFARRDEVEDDFRRIATQRILEGRPFAASVLFDEYVERIGDAYDGEPSPWQIPAMQFLQLEALSRADLLEEYDTQVKPNQANMTQKTTATDIDTIREHRLESFLDRPMFSDPDESDTANQETSERRAAFLSGVYIGQVSWFQEHNRSIGRTLDTRTQADKLTSRVLKQTIQTALDNARIYASESEHERDLLYPEVADRLLDAMKQQPTEWDIEKSELQFLVALGQSYGRRAMPVAFDIRDENTQREQTSTEDSTITEQQA